MKRSKWKGLFIHTLLYKFANTKYKNFGPTWLNQKINLRSSIYVKKLVRRSLPIHNGETHYEFKSYDPNYIGLKLGQLTYNRYLPPHSLINTARIQGNRKILMQRGKVKTKVRRSTWKIYKKKKSE
jgi:ribosomal protein S19